MFDDTQVHGETNDSKDGLDAFLKSLSPPKYDTPSPPEYESAGGPIDNVLKSEEGQRTLRNEIVKLGESAEDIDVSFKKIARGLDQALKVVTPVTQKTTGVLLRQLGEAWQGHHKTYIDLLWKSRRVAGHARAIATDFVEDFLPVLKEDYSIDDKKKEIAHYLKELEQDQKNSQELSDGFKHLREAVADFQQEVEKLKAMEADLLKQIERLEGEIASLRKKLDELCKSTLNSLGSAGLFAAAAAGTYFIGIVCWPLLLAGLYYAYKAAKQGVETFKAAMDYRDVSKSLEGKNKELVELQATLKEMEMINSVLGDLKGDIAMIQMKLGMFEQVWRCVVADLNELEKHLERATNVEMKALFEKKIERATTIYKTIARALYLYETNTHIRGLYQQ